MDRRLEQVHFRPALYWVTDPSQTAPRQAFCPAAIVRSWEIGRWPAISPQSAGYPPLILPNCPGSFVPVSQLIEIA